MNWHKSCHCTYAPLHRDSPTTYRLFLCDHPIQLDDIGVLELPHDGRLLQKPDLVLNVRVGVEGLDGHFSLLARHYPLPTVNSAKLARAKEIAQPAR